MKDMDAAVKWHNEYWKQHPQFKKSCIAFLGDRLIRACELEDFENLTVDWLARKIGVCESYLWRCYKYYFKIPIRETIINQKMKMAKHLLVTYPRLSINQIAEKLDYCDGNYFIKVFKKACKITPHQYRKKALAKAKKEALEEMELVLRRLKEITGFEPGATNTYTSNRMNLKMSVDGVKDNEVMLSAFIEDQKIILQIYSLKNSKKISYSYEIPLGDEDI